MLYDVQVFNIQKAYTRAPNANFKESFLQTTPGPYVVVCFWSGLNEFTDASDVHLNQLIELRREICQPVSPRIRRKPQSGHVTAGQLYTLRSVFLI